MKIAFLSFFSGLNHRGVETVVHEVASRLSERNELWVFQTGKKLQGSKYKTVTVATDWKSSDNENNFSLKRRFFLDKTSLAIRRFTQKVLPILKKEKFDVVIPWNNGWQAILVKLAKVGKIVAVGQSGLGWDDRIVLYLFPDRFVGFTDHQCWWARKINPFVKVVKIPNGVSPRFFKSQEKFDFQLEKPLILTVAAYTPIKRLDLAIKAVSKLKKGSLVLVGKGELEKELKGLAKKLLPQRHLFLTVGYNQLHKIYQSTNLLTFPSVSWESFGIVLLEAMASGLPIVANDDPIRREIVGNAGIFVDPTKTDEYAKALEKALKTNWGDKPRRQAEKFDWDKIAEKYEKLFSGLVPQ